VGAGKDAVVNEAGNLPKLIQGCESKALKMAVNQTPKHPAPVGCLK
jgi:hypothetical protein